MRIRALALALAGLAFVAMPCAASHPFWLGADLGLSSPTGDYKDEASLGILLGLTGTYMFNDLFGVGGDLALHSPGVADDFEEAMAVSAGAPVDVSFHAIQVTPHAKFLIPASGKVRPYVKGGLGLYDLGSKVEGGLLDVDQSDMKFGFNLGVGAQYLATSVFAVSGELAYHSISGDDATTSMLTLAAGVRFGFATR